MQKDFWRWHYKKEQLNDTKGQALFHEREVWWCALGANIGCEQDGGGELFTRPVIIIKKFNLDACLIVPLTARSKKGAYYLPIGMVGEEEAIAILSQLRLVDRKRLARKITTIEQVVFEKLIEAIVKACFPISILKCFLPANPSGEQAEAVCTGSIPTALENASF